MDSASATLDLLIDLESRHDELLMRLDELDKRVQNVLTDWQAPRPSANPSSSGPNVPTC
jgi:hypothetical protein